MSSIIDALKRAEAERQTPSGYELLNFHSDPLPGRPRRKSKFLAGAALMAGALLASLALIYFVFAGRAEDYLPFLPGPSADSGLQAAVKAPPPEEPREAVKEGGGRQVLQGSPAPEVSRASPAGEAPVSFPAPPAPAQGRSEEVPRGPGPAREGAPARPSRPVQASLPAELKPSPPAALTPRERAESFFNRARSHEDRGDLEAAVRAYEAALSLSPALLEARLNLGNIYFGRGSYEKAIEQYLEALKIDATYAKAHTNLGVAYAETGSVHLAVNEYKLSIKYEPDSFIPYYNLGALYARLGRHRMALDYLRQALALGEEARTLALADPDFSSLKQTPAFRKLVGGS